MKSLWWCIWWVIPEIRRQACHSNFQKTGVHARATLNPQLLAMTAKGAEQTTSLYFLCWSLFSKVGIITLPCLDKQFKNTYIKNQEEYRCYDDRRSKVYQSPERRKWTIYSHYLLISRCQRKAFWWVMASSTFVFRLFEVSISKRGDSQN